MASFPISKTTDWAFPCCRSGWFSALQAFHSGCLLCWRFFFEVEV
jgi:hypothetical protein